MEIDDYDFKPSVELAKELVAEPWDAASLHESLKSLQGSAPAEDFRQQTDRYTALAAVAMVAGDKTQAAVFAESAVAAAERIDFRFCGPHTRVLFPTIVQSGRSDLALQYLRRLFGRGNARTISGEQGCPRAGCSRGRRTSGRGPIHRRQRRRSRGRLLGSCPRLHHNGTPGA